MKYLYSRIFRILMGAIPIYFGLVELGRTGSYAAAGLTGSFLLGLMFLGWTAAKEDVKVHVKE